ncbi:hypothetical protein Tco_0755147 [Tanacetum coccineum]
MEPFVNMSEQPVHHEKAPVFTSETDADRSSHPLNYEADNLTGAPASRPRQVLTGQNIEEDTPEWCQELMVHLAPLATQEESNALTNDVSLQRAWFSLARGAMAQTNILERLENLLADYDTLADTHAECSKMVRKLVTAREDLEHNAKLYTDAINLYRAAARIQSLEAELARKDSALIYAEIMLDEKAKIIRNSLLNWVKLKLKNLTAFETIWGKGLSEGRTVKEIMAILYEFENFDPYSDKKLYGYDKLFEKKYPYIERIASGHHHSVADLLKVHPDPAPFAGTSTPTISNSLGGSGAPPPKKT